MKTLEEVRSFFEREIQPALAPLEIKRKKARRKTIFYHFLFSFFELAVISLTLSFIFILSTIDPPWRKDDKAPYFLIGIMFFVFSSGVVVAWLKKIRRAVLFQNEFKRAVMDPLVRFLWPELSYTPQKMVVPGALFLGSEIFPHDSYYPKGYWAEDFVAGRIGQTVFEFFEIDGGDPYRYGDLFYKENLYQGVIPVSEIPESQPEAISFKGLFFIADFNKSFKGSTLVRSEDRGVRSRWVRATGRELVRLEDPEFEKHFAVYSTDQVAARYILSPGLMRRLSEYKSKTERDILISFRYNRIFVAIDLGKNAFEVNVYRSLYDFENVREYYQDLRLVIDIIEDLNLNTRIWLREASADAPLRPEILKISFRNIWIYRILVFAGPFFFVIGAHNFYAGRYKRSLAQFLTINGLLSLGALTAANPHLFPNLQPWLSPVAVIALYAWILTELITTRTDANGDLMSRGNPFKWKFPLLLKKLERP